jgi:membrane-bound lytic murein transglycosylase B
MHKLLKIFLALSLTLTTPCIAQNCQGHNKEYFKLCRQFMHDMVEKYHFSEHELNHSLNLAQYQPQIITSMENPAEKKPWDFYEHLFISTERIAKGKIFWRKNKKILDLASREFGIPPDIIVAIIGVETMYGEKTGNYRVLDALSTLAFGYPKRAPFFTQELEKYFILCKKLHLRPESIYGSYAGAIGKPQFMPSSYLNYARAMHNKYQPDLMHNDADVIMSVANYLHKNKWQRGGPIISKLNNKHINYHIKLNQKDAAYNMWTLHKYHVIDWNLQKTYKKQKAGIIEIVSSDKTGYWLAFNNFYVIMRYNTSPQYALAVYLLAQQLR